MKKLVFILLFSFLAGIGVLLPQPDLERELNGYTPPDEVVSFSANLPFSKAVELISKISERKTGRKVVSMVQRENPVGLEIKNLHYEKALLLIVQYADLLLEKKEDVTIIKKKVEVKRELDPATYAEFNSRDVKISAVFFDIDVSTAKERGINWQTLLSQKNWSFGVGVKTTASTSTTSSTTDASVSTSGQGGLSGVFADASTLFRFLESENLGEIISSPTISVRDRTEGKIQVGSDFSIKTRDFAGNVTDKFFSTGSIVTVTPYIYTQDSIDYILISLEVERSSGFPSEVSTEIKKTNAKTQVVMLDGEETVIGGLILNEEKSERVGIPFLKDLPWWVLGIRYLTGADKMSVIKKELVIAIKVDLLPTLQERFANPDGKHVIQTELDSYRAKMKYYQFDPSREPKK